MGMYELEPQPQIMFGCKIKDMHSKAQEQFARLEGGSYWRKAQQQGKGWTISWRQTMMRAKCSKWCEPGTPSAIQIMRLVFHAKWEYDY